MLTGLLAIACIAIPQKVSGDQAELVRLIHAASASAIAEASGIGEMGRRLLVLSEVGEALQGPDDPSARRILEQAWRLSNSKPRVYGSEQVDIVHAMAAIDPDRGRALIAKIQESYRRDFAERFLPRAVTFRHPHLAAKLFQQKLIDQDLYDELSHLSSLRLDMAVRFLRMFPESIADSYAIGVAGMLKAKEAADFLTAMKLKHIPDPKSYWLATHPNPTGAELEAEAATMKKLRDRVDLQLKAIAAYRKTDPARGKALADQLCDQANSNGPLPRLEMRDFSIDTEWKYVLVPEIAQADTPKVRAFLDKVYAGKDVISMRAVGAWSEIDLTRATELADECKADYAVDRTDIGNFVDHGYEQFLLNLAEVNPEDAAKRVLVLKPELKWVNFSGEEGVAIEANKLLRGLWLTYPSEAKRFCAQFPPSAKVFGPKPVEAIDLLQLDRSACADPVHSEPLLKKLAANYSDQMFFLGVSPIYSMAKVMAALVVNDPDAAVRMSAVLANPDSRVSALVQAFNLSVGSPLSKRKQLLTAALAAATKIADRARRAFSFEGIATAAKDEWCRMQPWPPAVE